MVTFKKSRSFLPPEARRLSPLGTLSRARRLSFIAPRGRGTGRSRTRPAMSDDEDDAPIIMPNGVDFDDDDLNDDDLPEEEGRGVDFDDDL